jgi:hypothetical protein
MNAKEMHIAVNNDAWIYLAVTSVLVHLDTNWMTKIW